MSKNPRGIGVPGGVAHSWIRGMNKMRNNSNRNKAFTSSEKEQHSRLYNGLTSITDKRARNAIVGEIVRDMRELDIGV